MIDCLKYQAHPHVVQIHTGEINQKSMDSFVEKNSFVKSSQTERNDPSTSNGYSIFIQIKISET